MAKQFDLQARLSLVGPVNIKPIVNSIQSQLKNIKGNINVQLSRSFTSALTASNTGLKNFNNNLAKSVINAKSATQAFNQLSRSLNNIKQATGGIGTAIRPLQQASKQLKEVGNSIEDFGAKSALALKRNAAFLLPTTAIFAFVTAAKRGIEEAVEFDREIVRLSQVSGKSIAGLAGLKREITSLSTSLGVSSKELVKVSTTLAQAGFTIKDTQTILKGLAESSLAPTFSDIESTTEGVIAAFNQFKLKAEDVEGVLGSLNSVAAAYAVESDDLVTVVRRTGGAFEAAGGSLNELIALFTSVRQTTRESAETIATGFRTIFTRIQRPKTLEYLREFGIELSDLKGKFVGPYEAVRRLSEGLASLDSKDLRFAGIIEELGGFRQVSKVIPLIQQFATAQEALGVAEQGSGSLARDAATAQQSLLVQVSKVKEEFADLFRTISNDAGFQALVHTILDLAGAFAGLAKGIAPVLPLIAVLGAAKLGSIAKPFIKGFGKGFANGGLVPGVGNTDSVPATLTPGEFVMRKSAVKRIGADNLQKFASGGKVNVNIGQPDEFGGLIATKGQNTDAVQVLKAGGKKGINPTALANIAKKLGKDPSDIDYVTGKPSFHFLEGNLHKEFETIAKENLEDGIKKQLAKFYPGDEEAKVFGVTRGNVQHQFEENIGLNAFAGHMFEGFINAIGGKDTVTQRAQEDFDFKMTPKLREDLAPLFGPFPANLKYVDSKLTGTTSVGGSYVNILKKGANVAGLQNLLGVSLVGGHQADVLERVKSATKSSAAQPKKDSSGKTLGFAFGGGVNKRFDRPGYKTTNLYKGLGKSTRKWEYGYTRGYFGKPPEDAWKNNQEYMTGYAEGTKDHKKRTDLPGMASGGSTTDTVPAMLTPGEFVFNKGAAQRIGYGNLRKMNQGYANGGVVGFAEGDEVLKQNTRSLLALSKHHKYAYIDAAEDAKYRMETAQHLREQRRTRGSAETRRISLSYAHNFLGQPEQTIPEAPRIPDPVHDPAAQQGTTPVITPSTSPVIAPSSTPTTNTVPTSNFLRNSVVHYANLVSKKNAAQLTPEEDDAGFSVPALRRANQRRQGRPVTNNPNVVGPNSDITHLTFSQLDESGRKDLFKQLKKLAIDSKALDESFEETTKANLRYKVAVNKLTGQQTVTLNSGTKGIINQTNTKRQGVLAARSAEAEKQKSLEGERHFGIVRNHPDFNLVDDLQLPGGPPPGGLPPGAGTGLFSRFKRRSRSVLGAGVGAFKGQSPIGILGSTAGLGVATEALPQHLQAKAQGLVSGAGAGAAFGASIAPLLGPLAPIAPIAGAVVGGLGGLASALNEEKDKLAENKLAEVIEGTKDALKGLDTAVGLSTKQIEAVFAVTNATHQRAATSVQTSAGSFGGIGGFFSTVFGGISDGRQGSFAKHKAENRAAGGAEGINAAVSSLATNTPLLQNAIRARIRRGERFNTIQKSDEFNELNFATGAEKFNKTASAGGIKGRAARATLLKALDPTADGHAAAKAAVTAAGTAGKTTKGDENANRLQHQFDGLTKVLNSETSILQTFGKTLAVATQRLEKLDGAFTSAEDAIHGTVSALKISENNHKITLGAPGQTDRIQALGNTVGGTTGALLTSKLLEIDDIAKRLPKLLADNADKALNKPDDEFDADFITKEFGTSSEIANAIAANLQKNGNPREILEQARIDPAKTAEQLIGPVRDAAQGISDDVIKSLVEGANTLNASFTHLASITNQVAQISDRRALAGQATTLFDVQTSGKEATLSQLTSASDAKQSRLLGGVANDPDAIFKWLSEGREAQRKLEAEIEKDPALKTGTKGNDLAELKQINSDLGEALHNLAEPTERLAVINQKLADVEQRRNNLSSSVKSFNSGSLKDRLQQVGRLQTSQSLDKLTPAQLKAVAGQLPAKHIETIAQGFEERGLDEKAKLLRNNSGTGLFFDQFHGNSNQEIDEVRGEKRKVLKTAQAATDAEQGLGVIEILRLQQQVQEANSKYAQDLAKATTDANASLKEVSKNAAAIVEGLASIPKQIDMTVKGVMEVTFNGLQTFQSLEPHLQKLVTDQIAKMVDKETGLVQVGKQVGQFINENHNRTFK